MSRIQVKTSPFRSDFQILRILIARPELMTIARKLKARDMIGRKDREIGYPNAFVKFKLLSWECCLGVSKYPSVTKVSV